MVYSTCTFFYAETKRSQLVSGKSSSMAPIEVAELSPWRSSLHPGCYRCGTSRFVVQVHFAAAFHYRKISCIAIRMKQPSLLASTQVQKNYANGRASVNARSEPIRVDSGKCLGFFRKTKATLCYCIRSTTNCIISIVLISNIMAATNQCRCSDC